MTTKATRPVPPSTAIPAVEADERHQADVDSFMARNRDELNASIRRSRAEVAKGVQSARTIDDIIADGRNPGGDRAAVALDVITPPYSVNRR